jgi:WD40 repeat protein
MAENGKLCSRCWSPVTREMVGGICAACLLEEMLPAAEGLSGSAAECPVAADVGILQHFGPYELLEEVGRGGMGVIYRARHPGLDRIVALKMLLAGEFADAKTRERLLREARIAARLSHPGIVTIHDVGEVGGRPYFAMEYVPGRNLSQHCRDGLLPLATAVRYGEQLARAVHYAHQHGVIHRDLKPANVLITPDDEAKLTDFGLTKSLVEPTCTLESAGSPNYMAPEQADSALGTTGTHTDVFGLGAILYHLFTGRPPAVGESLSETLRAVTLCEPVPLRQLRPALPQDLETITLKCLEKEPSRRYGSAQEAADELVRWRNREPIRARPTTPLERLAKWVRRRPVVTGLLAACALTLTAGLAATIWQWRQAERARGQFERSAYYGMVVASMATKFEPTVRAELDRIPLRLRGWEWSHAYLRCVPEIQFVDAAGDSRRSVAGLEASPDRTHLAFWSDGIVRVVNLRNGTERIDATLPIHGVSKARFSPDGHTLAVVWQEGGAAIRSLDRDAPVRPLGAPGWAARSLTFTPDSASLVVVGSDGIVRLVAAEDGRLLRVFPAGDVRVVEASASSDGSLLLGVGEPGPGPAFVRWKTATGERLADEAVPSAPAAKAVLSPAGDRCALLRTPHLAEVRDTATGRLISAWSEPNRKLKEIALVLGGRRLLVRTAEAQGYLVNADNGGFIAALTGLTRALVTAADSPVALSLDSELGFRGWDLESGEPTGIFPLHPDRRAMGVMSPDGIVTAGSDGGYVYAWLSDLHRSGIPTRETGRIVALAHSPDSGRFVSADPSGDLRVWDSRSAAMLLQSPGDETNNPTAVDWSRDGRWITTASTRGDVVVRAADTLVPHHSWTAGQQAITAITTDAGSRCIATAGPEGLGLWELATGKARWFHPWERGLGAATFAPDDQRLFVTEGSGEVWEADIATGAKLGTTRLPIRRYPLIACSVRTARGRLLAVAVSPAKIVLLDATTLEPVGDVGPSGAGVQHLVFHPDGSRLAVVATLDTRDVEPSRLVLWDPWSRQLALSLNEPGLRLLSASFSPDGLQLIAGGNRGGIRIWDALPWAGSSPEPGAAGVSTKGESEVLRYRQYWLKQLEARDRPPRETP